MDVYQFLQIFASVICTITLALFVKNQSYRVKKGQNQADKEDIKSLTHLVESVKSDFAKEHAKLNADLNLIKDISSKIYSESQKSIITFQMDIDFLINSAIELKFGGLLQKDFKEFELKVSALETLKNKSRSSLNMMNLHVRDNDCLELASTLFFNIERAINDFLSNFKIIKDISDNIFAQNDAFDYYVDQGLDNEALQWIADSEAKFYKEVSSQSEQFSQVQHNLLITMQPFQLKFIERAKNYLSQP